MLGPEIAFCTASLTEVPWGSMPISVCGAAFAGTGMLHGHEIKRCLESWQPKLGSRTMTVYGPADEP